jgi:hypothetical protein
MTPEFRKAIFSWNYDLEKHGEAAHCIPLQLQRLFGLLQLGASLGNNRSVDTVALTKSFGWEGSEVFQQQDVQELTRVLFDALEETFKGDPAVDNIIDQLYAGELIDYLRCIDVDYQSERKDKFLDFSLAIVPFGLNDKPMHSLTECIEMFLRPELLDGDNKYYCEKYDKKVDAIKGLKFGKLPQLMSVQLKRFVYDFSGAYVVQKKLNDQVKFPMILNMNKYVARKKRKIVSNSDLQGSEVEKDKKEDSVVTEATTTATVDSLKESIYEEVTNDEFEEFLKLQMEKIREKVVSDASSSSSAEHVDNGTSPEETVPQAEKKVETSITNEFKQVNLEDDPAVPTLEESQQQQQQRLKSNSLSQLEPDHDVIYESLSPEKVKSLVKEHGEWIYELYAVLIHSGSATGGHYYAYIKDFNSHLWYNFNDSNVTMIDEKTVQETWGGSINRPTNTPSSYFSSSSYTYTPSFMSSYQSSANAYMLMYRQVTHEIPFIPDDIIPSYIQELVKEEQIKRDLKLKEEEEFRNKLNIRILFNGIEKIIPAKRTMTYEELLTKCWNEYQLTNVIQKQKQPSSHTIPSTESSLNETPSEEEKDRISGTVTPTTEITDTEEKTVSEENELINPQKHHSDQHSNTLDSTTTTTTQPLSSQLSETPLPYHLFRIRDYNQYTKILSTGFDYEINKQKTLSDLNYSDYKTYALEIRKPEQDWETYINDGFNVLVEEFDPISFSFKDSRSLRLPQSSTVADLKQQLIKIHNLHSINDIRVMKISNVGFHDAKMEILDVNHRRLREDYYIYEGMKLYCEKILSDSSGSEDKDEFGTFSSSSSAVTAESESLAYQAFLNVRNRMEIRYIIPTLTDNNNSSSTCTGGSGSTAVASPSAVTPSSSSSSSSSSVSPSHECILIVDARWKIQDLRLKIAEECHIPVENCRLFKMSIKGQELKDSETTLSNNGIYNGLTIAVALGRVTKAGFYLLNITLYNSKDINVGVKYLPELEPEVEEGKNTIGNNSMNDIDDNLYSTHTPPPSIPLPPSSSLSMIGLSSPSVPSYPPPRPPSPVTAINAQKDSSSDYHNGHSSNISDEAVVTAVPISYDDYQFDNEDYVDNLIDEGDNLSNKGVADENENDNDHDDGSLFGDDINNNNNEDEFSTPPPSPSPVHGSQYDQEDSENNNRVYYLEGVTNLKEFSSAAVSSSSSSSIQKKNINPFESTEDHSASSSCCSSSTGDEEIHSLEKEKPPVQEGNVSVSLSEIAVDKAVNTENTDSGKLITDSNNINGNLHEMIEPSDFGEKTVSSLFSFLFFSFLFVLVTFFVFSSFFPFSRLKMVFLLHSLKQSLEWKIFVFNHQQQLMN